MKPPLTLLLSPVLALAPQVPNQPIAAPHFDADFRAVLASGLTVALRPGGVAFSVSGANGVPTPFALRFIEARRDGGERLGAHGGQPRLVDGRRRAEYVHGVVTERYETVARGLEQSFLLTALPEGSGDLLIEVGLECDLQGVAEGRGLVFRDATGSGWRMGGVTAIDAAGEQSPGVLEYEAGLVRLRVGAEFVARAELPLLVDPLISGILRKPPPGQWGDGEVDVAAGGADGFYMISGTYPNGYFSSGQGILVAPDGSWNPVVYSYPSNGNALSPSSSYVRLRDAFVGGVLSRPAHLTFPIWLTSLYVQNGVTVFGAYIRVGRGLSMEAFDIGGESTLLDDDLLIVWNEVNGTQRTIVAAELEIDATYNGKVISQTSLGPADTNSQLVVSKGNGLEGRHLAVWLLNGDLQAAVIDRNLNVLDQGGLGQAGVGASQPDVDGNGRQWLITYANEDGELACLPVFWDSTDEVAYVGQERVIGPVTSPTAGILLPQVTPLASVAWSGNSYTLSYLDANDNSMVMSVDPFDCLPCEGPFVTQTRTTPRSRYRLFPAVASHHADATTQNDNALALTDHLGMVLFRSDDGVTTDLGGRCGRGGYTAAGCAVTGNAAFTVRLRDSQRSTAAVAVLGTSVASLPLGACTLRVDPNGAVLVPAVSDQRGNAALPLPLPALPSLVGATFVAQWAVRCDRGCAGPFELSDALQVQLQ